MAGTQSDLNDAERWRRAKDYIEAQIASHERVLDAGGISFDEFHVRSVKLEAYQSILEAADDMPIQP